MRGGRIFISYRRDDSRADSGRLYDRLSVQFPNRVFRDVASIEPGVEWDEAIAHVLSETDACIVVIGRNWINAQDETGKRRLDDPDDTVRQEVAAVLRRPIRVFPVLVGGATMPVPEELPEDLQPLCRRNAMELTEQHWDQGVQRLSQALDVALASQQQKRSEVNKPVKAAAAPRVAKPASFNVKWAALGAGILVLGAISWVLLSRQPEHVAASYPDARVTASSAGPFVGDWRAVVTTPAQRLDEDLELYPDHSFRFVSENSTVSLGKWQYDQGSNSVEVTDARDLKDGAKYSCDWKSAGAHDSLSGTCHDAQQNSWTVSLSEAPGSVADRSFNIPHIDLSALTIAERAAFSQSLAKQRCGCGMVLLTCLRKHPTCPFKMGLTQTSLAAFLKNARS